MTVLFGQGGARTLLARRAGEVAGLLRKGEAVAVVDLGGTANLAPEVDRGRASAATSIASSFQMLNRPLLSERRLALREALAVLRSRPGLDPKRIRLWGDGVGPANDAKGESPFDLSQPPHADPLGAHLAVLAALSEPGLIEVRARGGLVSWASLLESPAVHFPYDNVVPGALPAHDWPEVCEAVRLPIRLEALTDGRNRKVPLAEMKKLYAKAGNVTVSD